MVVELELEGVDFKELVEVEEEVLALPPPGLHTKQAVNPLSLASGSVAGHPVFAYRQLDR